MEFTIANLSGPLDDWTGTRIIIRSEDCPGGVAAIIGGAEEYANLILAAPKMHQALELVRRFTRSGEEADWELVDRAINDALRMAKNG